MQNLSAHLASEVTNKSNRISVVTRFLHTLTYISHPLKCKAHLCDP